MIYIKSNGDCRTEAIYLVCFFSFSHLEEHILTHCKDQKWEGEYGKEPLMGSEQPDSSPSCYYPKWMCYLE